jgi:uncharacterized Zn-finger protein
MASTITNNNDNTETTGIKKKKTEDMKQYMIEYRKKNLDKWLGEKTCPECGAKYMASNVSKHLKSKKHKIFMLEKENAKLKELIEIKNL